MLVVSEEGELLPIAHRLQEEGHNVTLHINDHQFAERGRGFVRNRTSSMGAAVVDGRTTSVADALRNEVRPDFVVLDTSTAPLYTTFRPTSKVWGASKWSYHASTNAVYAARIHRAAGIPAAPLFQTYIASTSEKYNSKASVAAWWDGSHFNYSHLMIEELGFMNDGVGTQIVSGVAVKPLVRHSRLVQDTLQQTESMLKKVAYTGPVYYGTSLGLGLGSLYDHTLFTIAELLGQDLLAAIQGEVLLSTEDWALGVRVSVPPFPNPHHSSTIFSKQRFKIEEGARRHLWLIDVADDTTTGLDGNLGWVTARGTSLRECARRAYRTIDNLDIPNLQYRTDIGIGSSKVLAALQSQVHV